MEERTFLGLELSTQQIRAVVVDDDLRIVHTASVTYHTDLPEFRTHGGVVIDKYNPQLITAPPIMWVKGLDILLDRLTMAGVDFSKLVSVSGSAQQHGSVYWSKNINDTLSSLDSKEFLHSQLASAFALCSSPVWMDSTTTQQCRELEKVVGGPEDLARITGSRAFERFTGPQIAKIYQKKPESYNRTERISLISSFLASLLIGQIAPIDISDASGMNLLDIQTKTWNQMLLDYCAPALAEKLGYPVPSSTIIGPIANYFVERFNFNPECKVVACTGDNPASLMGMRLGKNWIAVSLGTSDTVFLWLSEPKVVLNGHVLCNPIDENAYMALLCFKNGSMTRERIRNSCCGGSWDTFDHLLESTPRGNFGHMGLYFDTQEILPFLRGDYRFNKSGPLKKFTSLEVEVRAVIEGQFVAKRAYCEDFGFTVDSNTKILATGGASVNKHILQVLSDVFNAPVYVQETSFSAMLGAAYKAKHGVLANEMSYHDVVSSLPKPELVCQPYADAAEIYEPMVNRYRTIVDEILHTSHSS